MFHYVELQECVSVSDVHLVFLQCYVWHDSEFPEDFGCRRFHCNHVHEVGQRCLHERAGGVGFW